MQRGNGSSHIIHHASLFFLVLSLKASDIFHKKAAQLLGSVAKILEESNKQSQPHVDYELLS